MKTPVIAVMGPPDSGKTAFIRSLTNSKPIILNRAGHLRRREPTSAESRQRTYDEASQTVMYPCTIPESSTKFMLIDTIGLELERDPEAEIKQLIRAVIEISGHGLSGVLYLRRIIAPGSPDGVITDLNRVCNVFRDHDLQQVVFATTFWDLIPEKAGDIFEAEFLGEILDRTGFATKQGLQVETSRLLNTIESSVELVKMFRRWPNSEEPEDVLECDAVAKFFQMSETHISVPRDPDLYACRRQVATVYREANAEGMLFQCPKPTGKCYTDRNGRKVIQTYG